MAAPTPTARSTPGGIQFDDGFQTLITLENDPDIEFCEKSVTPPGIDGGDPIDTTTMCNTTWRTMRARALKTLTECSLTVSWDPILYDNILAQINVEQTFTVTFPDGSTLAFYAFLQSFTPGEMSEGEQPEADIVIVPTNYDPVNNVEAGPALANVTGT